MNPIHSNGCRHGAMRLRALLSPVSGFLTFADTRVTPRREVTPGRIFSAGRSVLVALLALFLHVGCEGTKADKSSPSGGLAASDGPVTLAAGDTVKLFFPGAPEFNNIQKVRTDGKLSLPLVGEVHAAGKRLTQLQSELSSLYKPQLQNTEVVVSLEASGSPVVISGAVKTPGKFVFDRPTTLLEAILGAGGFDEYANQKKVRLIRVAHGQYQTEMIDMTSILSGGNSNAIYVRGGDMIYVADKAF